MSTLFKQSFRKAKEAQIEALKQIRLEHQYNAQDTQLNEMIAKFWGCVAGKMFNDIENPQYPGSIVWAANNAPCNCNDPPRQHLSLINSCLWGPSSPHLVYSLC